MCSQMAEIPRNRLIPLLVLGVLCQPASSNEASSAYPIAGVNPQQRPANAPVQSPIQKNDDWYQKGLYGVEQPYPQSLTFLEEQGRWYTPFTRKGMTGPYDIRGWHRKEH